MLGRQPEYKHDPTPEKPSEWLYGAVAGGLAFGIGGAVASFWEVGGLIRGTLLYSAVGFVAGALFPKFADSVLTEVLNVENWKKRE